MTATKPPFVPFVLGRYSVLAPLGEGGMAEVFLAEQPGVQGFARLCTIKRVRLDRTANPELARLLVTEARHTLTVQHPNVVQVLELQEDAGQLYMVLEYVDGGDLHRLLSSLRKARQKLPVEVAVHMMCGVLRGLHHAHTAVDMDGARLNIIHRDISPSNVLITRQGVAKLGDFGVALALGQNPSAGGPVSTAGKPSYMPPEVLHGAPADIQGDVWACGVVLWESLTASRLFRGADIPEIMQAVLSGPIPPPSAIRPEVPQALDEMVLTALQRDPAVRFPDARSFELSLFDLLRDHHPEELGEVLANRLKTHARMLSAREIQALPRPTTGGAAPFPASSTVVAARPVSTTPAPGMARPAARPASEETLPVVLAPPPVKDWFEPPPPTQGPPSGSVPSLPADDFFAMSSFGPSDVAVPITQDAPLLPLLLRIPGRADQRFTAPAFWEHLRGMGQSPAGAVVAVEGSTPVALPYAAGWLMLDALSERDPVDRAPAATGYLPEESAAFTAWVTNHNLSGVLILEGLGHNGRLEVFVRSGCLQAVLETGARDHVMDELLHDALDANATLTTVLQSVLRLGQPLFTALKEAGLVEVPRFRQLVDALCIARVERFMQRGPCRFAFHLNVETQYALPPGGVPFGVGLAPLQDRGFDAF